MEHHGHCDPGIEIPVVLTPGNDESSILFIVFFRLILWCCIHLGHLTIVFDKMLTMWYWLNGTQHWIIQSHSHWMDFFLLPDNARFQHPLYSPKKKWFKDGPLKLLINAAPFF